MDMIIDWTALFEAYKGKWVALEDDEKTVIAAGVNPQTVKSKANKQGFAKPIMMKIPNKLTPYIGRTHAPSHNHDFQV